MEAIIALPTDMFFNTGIATYVWVLSNRKLPERRGLVQLIDASTMWRKMRKSLGSKRREMVDEQIDAVTRLFGDGAEAQLAAITAADGTTSTAIVRAGEVSPAAPEGGRVKLAPLSRLFRTEAFGYRSITVERPLRDESGQPVVGQKGKAKGKLQLDPALRDTETVPLGDEVKAYVAREVLPHAQDAWIDDDKTKIGYEIPFNRHFYVFEPPRPLAEIDAELKQVTDRILTMISGQTA